MASKTNNNKATVLVIDDEQDILDLLSITLKRMDLECLTAANLKDGKNLLSKQTIDLCLTDMRLPDGDGLDFVEWMQKDYSHIPVAVITAHGNVKTAVKALKLGAFDFVSKPVDLNWLRKLVQTAIKIEAEEISEADLHDKKGKSILGSSQAIKDLKELIKKVARSQAPIHIRGESGTGKELVARLIHDIGPRAEQAFIPVNCGAIPSELMEGEFFGHKKGSFTGANADKLGLIRSAEGGTLLLDEVGDLPLHMQVKLLRVIQEKAVRPVGGTEEIPVNVRILSATHQDLLAKVKEGLFREDLYYRINVIDITVPPLRDRNEDLFIIAEHIMQRLVSEQDLEKSVLTNAAKEKLRHYHFPGNVRELENLLERAVALSDGGEIQADDLMLREVNTETSNTEASGLHDYLTVQEKVLIEKALTANKYNKTKTAKELGLTLRQLRYKIEKLGL